MTTKNREEERRIIKERFFVDATPDGGYALRILRTYRADCDYRWSESTTGLKIPKGSFLNALNKMQEDRAKELDEAIIKLTKSV